MTSSLPMRVGPGASHAWAEVAVPGAGWIEIDPTNPKAPLERYVRVAVGRDYDDVPPLRGRYTGTARQRLTVAVSIREVDAPAAGEAAQAAR